MGRKTMPRAFNSIIYRLVAFFCVGALCVGIVCPYTSPDLLGALGPSAARSPYTISMRRLNIGILPDIVNALIATSILSAGNSYVFGTSRALYSLALAGQAPRVLTKLNRNGPRLVDFPCHRLAAPELDDHVLHLDPLQRH